MSLRGVTAIALFQVDVHHQWSTQVATKSLIADIAGSQPQAQSLVDQQMLQQLKDGGTACLQWLVSPRTFHYLRLVADTRS